MSRSESSIFDSSEEAALTLTLVAKGMINVDDFPEKMRSGTSKVMLEVSGRFLLETEAQNENVRGNIIHKDFKTEEEKNGVPGA